MAVTINLETDTPVPVANLTERRLGRRASPPTLWRWRTKGVRGVRLPMVLVFGQWCTTDAVLTEFLRATSEAGMSAPEPPTERSAATERRLRAAGLL